MVTRADRLGNRGKPAPRPVAEAARELGLDVLTPAKIGAPDVVQGLLGLAPDCLVVAAYGQILPPALLDAPPYGAVNVHASLLPRWRGASPIAHAILAGDAETGVSIMRMDAGLDTGPVYAMARVAIDDQTTTPELTARLAGLGASELAAVLSALEQGVAVATPQPETGVTLAPRLRREDGRVDWGARRAIEVDRMVRALKPWPGRAGTHRRRRRPDRGRRAGRRPAAVGAGVGGRSRGGIRGDRDCGGRLSRRPDHATGQAGDDPGCIPARPAFRRGAALMPPTRKPGDNTLASNRRARYEYSITETLEAGIELTGTEVKSLRTGRIQLRDGYVRIENGQAWLIQVNIASYQQGNRNNPEPERRRRLLLHKREIEYLDGRVRTQGLTIIPLKLYLVRNRVKVEIGLARGKKLWDKRQDVAKRDAERDMERAIKR